MEDELIRLGVIGLSDGNGHPYSWSAICNGYNQEGMRYCPFPVIPEYLEKEIWPDAQINGAKVTHIWTQSIEISKKVAMASMIDNIVDDYVDLIPHIDAVLLARDDAENHHLYAEPFLKAGLPIFIDKPLALTVAEAEEMLKMQKYEAQLFSCSSLRYANELFLTDKEREIIGDLEFIEARISNSWNKYAVHLIEPIVAGNPNRGNLREMNFWRRGTTVKANIQWENLEAYIYTYGQNSVPLEITYIGRKGYFTKELKDTFSAFKNSIQVFLDSILNYSVPIRREETLEIVKVIENGNKS